MGQLVSLTGKINDKKVPGQIAFFDIFFLLLTFFYEEAHHWTHAMSFIEG